MQPNQPIPNPQSPAPRPRFSVGPGAIIGVVVLLAGVYMLDHAGTGDVAVFSSVDRRISTPGFQGGQCTAIFGSCKYDLRDAQMQGREAVLTSYALFGGVEVLVPDDWEVVSRGFAVFGSVGDRTRHPSTSPDKKTLILDGAAVFGSVQAKN